VLDRSLGDGVVPIIIVPSASQTLITIYNVKEFLEDGVFMPSEERMRATKGGKPESVTVQKKLIRTERAGVPSPSRLGTSRLRSSQTIGGGWWPCLL
jgi:parafibromin